MLAPSLWASQTVVSGTNYPNLFSPAGNVTVTPPAIPDGVDLVTVELGGSESGPLGTYWTAEANGGAVLGTNVLGALIGEVRLAETGAQVALTGSALQFNIDNNPNSILGALGTGLGVSLNWSATAKFNAPGHALTLSPNTTYLISFDVIGGSGLLNSALGITPTFTTELLDGANAPVGISGGGTLLNLVGLQLAPVTGAPAGTGRATAEFRTGASVSAAPASVRFKGSAVLPASLVGIGTQFANVSNLSVVVKDAYSVWVEDHGITNAADQLSDADPDHDGKPNLQEFALATDPNSGTQQDTYFTVGDPDGSGPETSSFIMTIPVRSGASFATDNGGLEATQDGAHYRVEGSYELANWTLAISEVTPNAAFTAGLAALPGGWTYRSFRVPGQTSSTPRAFFRVLVD
ncbi:hypothetical protein [Haloferula sp. BvORR071]|uniref:hypothetical protein n=1 Tax=Haloferula sp. BvORR071 TaxID=1396141 RepID=UPI0005539EEA|nr:hypothetical protein [Haloferula sp. BvORR071]